MKIKEQKEYEVPQTTCLEVELEQGFMNGSVFKDSEESTLDITNHEVDETFDFSNNNEWK